MSWKHIRSLYSFNDKKKHVFCFNYALYTLFYSTWKKCTKYYQGIHTDYTNYDFQIQITVRGSTFGDSFELSDEYRKKSGDVGYFFLVCWWSMKMFAHRNNFDIVFLNFYICSGSVQFVELPECIYWGNMHIVTYYGQLVERDKTQLIVSASILPVWCQPSVHKPWHSNSTWNVVIYTVSLA